jgi:predicted MPP superfamily phosphohydrolase
LTKDSSSKLQTVVMLKSSKAATLNKLTQVRKPEMQIKQNFRAVFISDVHLGSKDCQAGYLLSFLQQCHSQKIYLLGDIVDFWAMQKQVHWGEPANQLLKLLLEKAEQGVEVIYVPGNHDEAFRHYAGKNFGLIQVQLRATHTTLLGKNYCWSMAMNLIKM